VTKKKSLINPTKGGQRTAHRRRLRQEEVGHVQVEGDTSSGKSLPWIVHVSKTFTFLCRRRNTEVFTVSVVGMWLLNYCFVITALFHSAATKMI